MSEGKPRQDERRRHHERNRRSWNAVTPAHNSHKRDQARFLAGGGSTLFPDELELLGDVAGRRIAHLQCNCGQDSLGLAALGASVTGVDIADDAIAFARELSRDSGIDATFVRADVLDWLEETEERFDVAFATYGTIGWLSDLAAWARGVARILVPGGRLILLEFHPLVWSIGSDGRLIEPYFVDGPLQEPNGVNDYVGERLAPSGYDAGVGEFRNPEPAVAFQWTVAGVTQQLIDAGLEIRAMREYPYCNGCEVMPGMRTLPGNRYATPEGVPSMPLMFGLVAGSARR